MCLLDFVLRLSPGRMDRPGFLAAINRHLRVLPLAGPLTQDRLPGLIRSGEIPLSVDDLINLTLENNLDISVSRLSPIASEYSILTNNRPFEPTLRFSANVVARHLPEHDAVDGRGFGSSLSQRFHGWLWPDAEDRR